MIQVNTYYEILARELNTKVEKETTTGDETVNLKFTLTLNKRH